jgi:hypothetical protein
MALLISDSFALYNNQAGALTAKGWSASSNLSYRQIGRFGAGSYCLNLYYQYGITSISQAVVTSGSTSVVGFAFNLNGNSGSQSGVPLVMLYNGTTYVSVWTVTPSGTTGPMNLAIHYGSTGPNTPTAGVTQYTTTLNLSNSLWYYVELKVNWAATTGQCILRVDGTQYYDSGTVLSLGVSNTTAVIFGQPFSGTNYPDPFLLADVLLMDGSGTTFNDFQGDVRIETLFPTSDGTNTGWTRSPATNLVLNANVSRAATDATAWPSPAGVTRVVTGSVSGGGYGADTVKCPNCIALPATGPYVSIPNGTSGFAVTAGHVLGCSAFTNGPTGSYSQIMSLRFYDSGGGTVGSDLQAFSIIGQFFWIFGFGTVTVPTSAVTAAVVLTNNAGYLPFTSYFTGICVVDGGTVAEYIEPATTAHYFSVAESNPDGDNTYNSTNTLNAKDTYHLGSLLSSSGAILGVKAVLVTRREAAGTRVVTPVARVSGTDYLGATGFTPPASLAYANGENVWSVSPATTAAWTRAEVNAMEIGPQLTT